MNRKTVEQSNASQPSRGHKMFSQESKLQSQRLNDHSAAPTNNPQSGYPPSHSGYPYYQPAMPYPTYPYPPPSTQFPGGYAGWWGPSSYPNSSNGPNAETPNGRSTGYPYGNYVQGVPHPLPTQVPYPHYRDPSSTPIGQINVHEGSAQQAEKGPPSWWTTTPYGQNYPGNRNDSSTSLHKASHGSSSRGYPTSSAPAHSQEKFDLSLARPLPQLAPYKLSPMLNAQQKEYPSIDWKVWNAIHTARAWVGKGVKGELEMKKEAFIGTVEVREPIFIASFPEKVNTFSIAITRWKPIVVVPQGPWSTIKIGDVMMATFLWLNEPIKRDEWATFSDDLRKMIMESFEMRRAYGKTQTAVVGQAENNPRRVDTLLCRVRWNGIVLAEDFAKSKVVYLRLLDER